MCYILSALQNFLIICFSSLISLLTCTYIGLTVSTDSSISSAICSSDLFLMSFFRIWSCSTFCMPFFSPGLIPRSSPSFFPLKFQSLFKSVIHGHHFRHLHSLFDQKIFWYIFSDTMIDRLFILLQLKCFEFKSKIFRDNRQ